MFWTEEGNAYVLANIRGGGEYGPEWHKSVLRENRQKSFDDLHAVAEDLIRTGVTAKGKIGISGRSNGGVLVGAAMNQRPDLYSAVINGSPLLDMKRYSHLLAGASWIDEYGDPDKPAGLGLHVAIFALPEPQEGRPLPGGLLLQLDQGRPGPSRPRPQDGGAARGIWQPLLLPRISGRRPSVGADHAEDAKRAALLMAYLKRELVGRGDADVARRHV